MTLTLDAETAEQLFQLVGWALVETSFPEGRIGEIQAAMESQQAEWMAGVTV